MNIFGAQVPEGEELNLALQAEVLYFTLLGLRAAAAGEHLWWKNNARGDMGVDLVAAIRSGESRLDIVNHTQAPRIASC